MTPIANCNIIIADCNMKLLPLLALILGAVLCDDKRDYDAAVACFEKAVELDPSHTGATSAPKAIAPYRRESERWNCHANAKPKNAPIPPTRIASMPTVISIATEPRAFRTTGKAFSRNAGI